MKKFQSLKLNKVNLNIKRATDGLPHDDLTNKAAIPQHSKQVRMILEENNTALSKGYNLSLHYPMDNAKCVHINYSLQQDLEMLLLAMPGNPAKKYQVNFATLITEVMEDVAQAVTKQGIAVKFNKVQINSGEDLKIIGTTRDLGNAVFLTKIKRIGDPSPAIIELNIIDFLSKHIDYMYTNYHQFLAAVTINLAYIDILRSRFYHEIGHILGLDHPEEPSSSRVKTIITIEGGNSNITYSAPIMTRDEKDYYKFSAPTLIDRESIRFSNQELFALLEANSDHSTSQCLYITGFSSCKALYIADSRHPSEIFNNADGFQAILYQNMNSKVNRALAVKEEGLNEHVLGYSIKSQTSKYIMTSGNLNKLLEGLSSFDFTDGSPIYVYETYPQYAYDPKKYYEQFIDKDTILPKFERILNYEPYICLDRIKSDEIYRAIKYEYSKKDVKYTEISSIKNAIFVKKPQVLDLVFPGNTTNWGTFSGLAYNWEHSYFDHIKGIPLGLSPHSHAGGQGAGILATTTIPTTSSLGSYGPYRGKIDLTSTDKDGYSKVKFTYNNQEVGELYCALWPSESSSGEITGDLYFTYPLSVLAKNKWEGFNIKKYLNSFLIDPATMSINTPGISIAVKKIS
ncbi:hypothetical protein ABSA28_00212 [Candidatus Hepatincolaceae symbiont of Richtersius coronifer]